MVPFECFPLRLGFIFLQLMASLIISEHLFFYATFRCLKKYFESLCRNAETCLGLPQTPEIQRQFLATESPLKVTKNGFYFALKVLFIYEIFQFLFRIFGHIGKRLDKKAKVNFRIYDATNLITNRYNTHIARYLKK